MKLPVTLSLRTRLLIADVISVMDKKLQERARIHLEEQKQLLNAALSVPLASRQYRAIIQILERVRSDSGITYLVLFDHNDNIVASAGWDEGRPLPAAADSFAAPLSLASERVHTAVNIESGGIRIGSLHFGIS